MKKIFVFLFAISSFSPNVFAEGSVNMNIVEYYREIKYINYECALFTPLEFIELCKDSVGMEKLSKDVAIKLNSFENWPAHEVQECKLLITMVRNNILKVKVTDKELIKSQKYIAKELECFCIDTNVSDDFIYRRLTLKPEEQLELDSREVSMLVFLINDPIGYSNFIFNNKDIFNNQNYISLGRLQECEIPNEISERQKEYILDITKNTKNECLQIIYQKVYDCDITLRCD